MEVQGDETIQLYSRYGGRGPQPLVITENAVLPTDNPYINAVLHFVACAQGGPEPLTSGDDNIKTIRFIEAIYDSARTGQVAQV